MFQEVPAACFRATQTCFWESPVRVSGGSGSRPSLFPEVPVVCFRGFPAIYFRSEMCLRGPLSMLSRVPNNVSSRPSELAWMPAASFRDIRNSLLGNDCTRNKSRQQVFKENHIRCGFLK